MEMTLGAAVPSAGLLSRLKSNSLVYVPCSDENKDLLVLTQIPVTLGSAGCEPSGSSKGNEK
jgi:hypothetical protein